MELSANPSSLEVSKDGSLLTVTHGNVVTFLDSEKYVIEHCDASGKTRKNIYLT